jgi:hypothetical protein
MLAGKRNLARRLDAEETEFREVGDNAFSSLATGYLLDT